MSTLEFQFEQMLVKRLTMSLMNAALHCGSTTDWLTVATTFLCNCSASFSFTPIRERPLLADCTDHSGVLASSNSMNLHLLSRASSSFLFNLTARCDRAVREMSMDHSELLSLSLYDRRPRLVWLEYLANIESMLEDTLKIGGAAVTEQCSP